MSEDVLPEQEPLMRWEVPGLAGSGSVDLSVSAGQALVLVGANGTGKSALSYWMSVNRGPSASPITRVIAHRRIWLSSPGAEITTSQRARNESDFSVWDSTPDSRTRIIGEDQRSARVLYDLLARVNARNSRAAARYDRGEVAADGDGIEEDILSRLERIFAAAGLGKSFHVTDSGGFDAASPGGISYPISTMSDGEKGAFLLASEALLSPPGGILLVDEPERHLHRSISSDFIVALMAERPDCGFVLFTHDLDLVGKLDPACTTVCTVNDVSWGGSDSTGWSLRVEPGPLDVPDAVRQAILGGRTRLLFVEGEVSSLDFPLYRLLYPDRTVVACGGSDDVKRAVAGLADSGAFHWVDGRGVLDGDARSADEIASLSAKQILVLPVNEVENLYYLSSIVDAVAQQQGLTLGESGADLAATARTNALASLKDQSVEHLASENAAKILRQQAMASLPSPGDLIAGGQAISVDLVSPYQSQVEDLRNCIATSDYDGVVERFSIRDSAFMTAVAKSLRFQSHSDYEKAVRSRLVADAGLLTKLREVVGELP